MFYDKLYVTDVTFDLAFSPRVEGEIKAEVCNMDLQDIDTLNTYYLPIFE